MKGKCQYFRFKISVNHCKKCIAMYNINKAFHDISDSDIESICQKCQNTPKILENNL